MAAVEGVPAEVGHFLLRKCDDMRAALLAVLWLAQNIATAPSVSVCCFPLAVITDGGGVAPVKRRGHPSVITGTEDSAAAQSCARWPSQPRRCDCENVRLLLRVVCQL